jgi:hypothetical protein
MPGDGKAIWCVDGQSGVEGRRFITHSAAVAVVGAVLGSSLLVGGVVVAWLVVGSGT